MGSPYRPRIADAELGALQLVASSVLLDVEVAARQALAVDPALWNQVRRAVDATAEPGQFLLTGSAVPADDTARHTGAGRFAFLRLRPMALVGG